MRTHLPLAAALVFLRLTSIAAPAQPPPAQPQTNQPPPEPRPVPAMQAVPLAHHEISFQRDGAEIARYVFGPDLRRPFVFPVIGPSGRSLTRMGHPHDPETHSHHNSVWISHNDVNGVSFWGDSGKGRIVHRRIERLDDGPDACSVFTVNAWTTDEGKVLFNERRQTTAQLLPNNEWLLIIDLQLDANGAPVTLGKTPFGPIGVRMAKTIGVNDGGGTIRNSEGGVNEAGVHWKRARWVDYSGPITAGATEGITLMDHPANPDHPTFFHVRNDGWMGASLTHDAPREIEPGKPLALRYGLYIHAGKPTPEVLDQRWQEFSKTALPELKTKR
jgi:methane monooxygenase PmoA-like